MLNLKKVAITGGLSCGKSSVTKIFKELGAQVVDTDEIVHRLLSPETKLGQQVINLISPDIVVNHQIDRSRIAERVFNQPKLLQQLETLLHPAVRKQVQKTFQQAEQNKQTGIIAVEVPLLFEAGHEEDFDYTITVVADPKIAKKRFSEKTGDSESNYDKRMARQLSAEEKSQRADFVIDNSSSLDELTRNVKIIFDQINQRI